MKQVLQNLSSGSTLVEDVPAPLVRGGALRIATAVTLVSAGTERMLVDFARGSLISKAKQQPDKVRQVLQKARTDGVSATLDAVLSKLDQPMALGYCNVGRVLEVGAGVSAFAVGDRLVSNGRHAEVVVAPSNLCARVPDNVPDEHAAFTALGAIALQGVRLAQPTLGETVVVSGLGLIGLMAVQILVASGCRVLGVDSDPQRLALARLFGAQTVDLAAGEDPLAKARAFSDGRGIDAVLLTLSSASDEPVSQAAQMCRKRGRIILVGVTGLKLNRADFYEKEISFQVSCSYGPGRYDPLYEERGQDYPLGFVRWTEQRNFEAVLELMSSGRLDVGPLVTHRFDIEQAAGAYDVLSGDRTALGIILLYGRQADPSGSDALATSVVLSEPKPVAGQPQIAMIGAGNYGGRVLIKAFQSGGAALRTLVSASGVSAVHFARKFGFARASSDASDCFDDPAVDAVCIATRHDSHAAYALAALAAGKHVFVEKPLCLTMDELDAIAASAPGKVLMVGFNRRFAPMVVKLKALLAPMVQPKVMVMTVNAGSIPSDHWTQDPAVGGGRLVGEACHFIDLLRHLAGAPIVDVLVRSVKEKGGPPASDIASISLTFEDGSLGIVNYLSNGHKAHPKERLEVFCGGRVAVLDNFRSLKAHGWTGFSGMKSMRQDKGQSACVAAFVTALAGGPPPIPLDEILEVSRLSIQVASRAG
jgi:predicted dehydrogenase/threonine dehydrogenase-like Zn-dependent dehydrogenase